MNKVSQFFNGPHHVGIVVSNFEISVNWYREKLGFVLVSQTSMRDIGLKFGFMKAGNFAIEVFESAESTPMVEQQKDLMPSLKRQGYAHLAFGTDNCDATWEWLNGLGVELHLPPTTNAELGVRYCFIKDPDGVLIEFIQDL